MPLHDGWPVLAAAPPVPVVAVSSSTGLDWLGLAACLPKPCAAAELVAAVTAVLTAD